MPDSWMASSTGTTGKLGIRIREREQRPLDQFLYTITLPDGIGVNRTRSNLFLRTFGWDWESGITPNIQTLLSLTLPTSTGPDGYGKGVISVGVLNSFRTLLHPPVDLRGRLWAWALRRSTVRCSRASGSSLPPPAPA